MKILLKAEVILKYCTQIAFNALTVSLTSSQIEKAFDPAHSSDFYSILMS